MARKSTSNSLPEALSSNLEALRSHYQDILNTYEEQVNNAREQMIHIEALLGQSEIVSIPTPAANKVETAPARVSTKSPKQPRQSTKTSLPAPKTTKAQGKSKRKSLLEFLAPYQGKTMLQAIAQMLQERKGKVVPIDQAVDALYGDLNPDLFKVAKERVMKSLSKGKQESLWESVPNQLGCYTLSVKALKG